MPRTVVVLFAITVASVGPIRAQRPAPTPPAWTLTVDEDIRTIRAAPFNAPIALIETKNQLLAVERASGEILWSRDHDAVLGAVHRLGGDDSGEELMPRLRAVIGDRQLAVVDVETGATVWTTEGMPFEKILGYLPAAGDRFFILGETATSKSSLASVLVTSGEILWQQNEVFTTRPTLFNEPGGALSTMGHQAPLTDTDTTVILYVSKDGPIKVHRETGAVIWRASGLAGRDPPASRDGYAGMTLSGGVLFTPYHDKRLAAVDATTGDIRWVAELRNRVRRMTPTPPGIVAFGYNDVGRGQFLVTVDPATGDLRWPKWFEHPRSAFAVYGESLYLMSRDQLFVAIDIATGALRDIAALTFEHGDPDFVQRRRDGWLLVSSNELTLVDSAGSVTMQRGFHKPGGGLLGFMRDLSDPGRPEQATGLARDYAFIFTDQPDPEGREGRSMVKVHKDTGEEHGRIWFAEKEPEYTMDVDAGLVYVRRGKKEIAAVRFPTG